MRHVKHWASRLGGAAVAIALLAAIAGLTLIETDSAGATHVNTHVFVGQTNGGGPNGVNQFNAASITITAGDTVTWQSAPDGRRHDVTSSVVPAGEAAFTSGDLDSDVPPATFARAFTAAGTYTYYCTFHAQASEATLANIDANIAAGLMVGKVVVQAAAPDTTAPTASAVAAAPNPTDGASSVALTATVTDSGTPLGTIASAQYRIDAGAPVSMTAADGTFNAATENVQANVPVGSLSLGNHTIEVQGTDNAGNIGAWVALTGGLNKTDTPVGAVVASVSVLGGGLTNTAQNIAFGNVTLGGADQTIPAASAVWQAQDARGTGDGWNVTLSSTSFTGAGTITADNFKVRQLQAQVVTVGGNTAPTSQVLSFQSLSGAPLKLLSATGGAGMGTYDYTPDFQLTVPASTAAGAYTANVTVTINSGP